MGISLTEYADANPMPDMPEAEKAGIARTAAGIKDRQERIEKAEKIKQGILCQLEQGNEPQYILYSAITAIGLLTSDSEWAAAAHGQLDSMYDDLAQQSLLADSAAIEAQRIQELQDSYNEKLRQQMIKQLAGCKKIERALKEVLGIVNDSTEEKN